MYDFYLGSKEEIEGNKEKYLLSIKRMMPKWMNSIPDSEFLALSRVADKVNEDGAVFVETGAGASSLVLLFHAMKNKGRLYSWDTNGEKISRLRAVFNETISRHFDMDINKIWKPVTYNSTSQYAGISILKELGEKVNLFFHDSEHVLDVVMGEIKEIKTLIKSPGLICLDDANYNFKHTNLAYINIVRKKLGLNPIPDIEGNNGRYFFVEIEEFLNKNFEKVMKIRDSYKNEYIDDIYFQYFDTEFQIKAKMKMENKDLLGHRFDAWEVI